MGNEWKCYFIWNAMDMNGIIRMDRVVAEFSVWLDPELFPVPKMRVKVFQRSDDFAAFANMSRRDPSTGALDGTAGLGATAEEALNDLLTRFVVDVRESFPSSRPVESDFAWSDPQDF